MSVGSDDPMLSAVELEAARIWETVDNMKKPVPHFVDDCPKYTVHQGWTVQGYSSAGERTGFYIPELRLFLDGGMNSRRNAEAILVTHSHNDHVHNLPCIAMGMEGNLSLRPPVHIPTEACDLLRLYARVSQAFNDTREVSDADEMNVTGVQPGDEFVLKCGKKGSTSVQVKVIECVHAVPCCGYILSSLVKKLKPDFVGVSPAEIQKRRQAGEEVTSLATTTVMAFLGDTTTEVFDRNPSLLDVPVIFTECTGFGSATVDKMRSRGHTHWDDLEPVIASRPQTTFVLMHLSQAVKPREAVECVVAAGHRNVSMFLHTGIVHISVLIDAATTEKTN